MENPVQSRVRMDELCIVYFRIMKRGIIMLQSRFGVYSIAFIVLVGFYMAASYNTLVRYNTAIQGQWANVETQYQRRYDLIPNLVNATKGLMTQERVVFQNIAQARQAYAQAKAIPEKVEAASQLDGAIARLLAIVENYPQLKTNEAVLSLMDELAGTENRIAVERKRYNDEVRQYNAKIMTFPSNIVARIFTFQAYPYFTAEKESAKPPKVDFGS
jgi:LemA protein